VFIHQINVLLEQHGIHKLVKTQANVVTDFIIILLVIALLYHNNALLQPYGMELAVQPKEMEIFVLKELTLKERNVIHIYLVKLVLFGIQLT
jgi:hypothetical protein